MERHIYPKKESRTEKYCDKCGICVSKGEHDGAGGSDGHGAFLSIKKFTRLGPPHYVEEVDKIICLVCAGKLTSAISKWKPKYKYLKVGEDEEERPFGEEDEED